MKYLRHILSLIGGFLFLQLNAQVSVNPLVFNEALTDEEPYELIFLIMRSDFINTSGDTAFIGWRKHYNTPLPVDWNFSVADKNVTYTPNLQESVQPIEIPPGSTEEFINLEGSIIGPGCVEAELILFDYYSPNIILDTIRYSVNINNVDCNTTGIVDAYLQHVEVFPNPSGDFITLPDDLSFDEIRVTNSLGQIIRVAKNESTTIQVSDLAPGMYVITVFENGKVVGIGKVVKE